MKLNNSEYLIQLKMSAEMSSSKKVTKSKKVVEEPECCMVCMNNYTSIIRKK